MEQLEYLAKSYTQAPWRRQLQLIGLFSLFLVLAALVAGIYLNVSAKTAIIGRDIQAKQRMLESLDRDIEDRTARLASILSVAEMEARARKLGFEQVQPEQIVYLKLPGYIERSSVILAPYAQKTVVSAPMIPAEYTESLFTWLRRQASFTMLRLSEAKP
ncbi:MAG: hypothetical protein QME21_10340 [Anaerolineales bacterium]|jgi:hypothetical protein|nr:hypothetical protein [Anaerolineales bacterium]